MADDNHIARLKQGVAAWNAWRDENPDSPDLRKADLRKADLSNADLRKADLSGANLSQGNLKWANLPYLWRIRVGSKVGEGQTAELGDHTWRRP
jgi:hypothetical protein